VNVSELFWSASFEDLKCGYIQEEDHYVCLLCGKKIEKGIVYPEEGVFYEAGRYMRIHIEQVHQSVFEHLNSLDKKLTGLTDHQNNLISLFYQGKSDAEVQKEMGIGSASTIRESPVFIKRERTSVKGVFSDDGTPQRKEQIRTDLFDPSHNSQDGG